MKAYVPIEVLEDLKFFIGDSEKWLIKRFEEMNIEIDKILIKEKSDFNLKITLEDGREFHIEAKVVGKLEFYLKENNKNGNK
mgnify:CR=1 FL=1